jgi:hypothetical protein
MSFRKLGREEMRVTLQSLEIPVALRAQERVPLLQVASAQHLAGR